MSGYNEDFLQGFTVPLPAASPNLAGKLLQSPLLRDGLFADYINYTVMMDRTRRAPIVAALNINQSSLEVVDAEASWKSDTRIGDEFQLNNDYYASNPWDRGHMARRASAAWGPNARAAKRASDETFYFSNAALQHANFNRDEWVALEDWAKDLDLDEDGLITSFSGPVYGAFARTLTPQGRPPATIPSSFFKIVCFKNKLQDLEVRSFIVHQDEQALEDRRGRRTINFQTYQVSVTEIEQLTGLDFPDILYDRNPLYFHENQEASGTFNISHFPERIEVDSPAEVIASDTVRDFFEDDHVPVFIAAAMVNPVGRDTGYEWISIINLSPDVVDLDGWTLSDTIRRPLEISSVLNASQCKIAPGEAVCVNPVSPIRLTNSGGVIALFDGHRDEHHHRNHGRRIDRVKYTAEQGEIEGVPIVFTHRSRA